MYISIPPNGYTEFSEGVAVEFTKHDGTKWVGNLATGQSNLKFAAHLKNGNDVLIIASGICYIIDPDNLLSFIEFGFNFHSVSEHKNSFILVGKHAISIVENRNSIIHFPDLSYDGIEVEKLENDKLYCVSRLFNSSYDFEESKFVLDLNNKVIIKEYKVEWWKFWK